MTKRGVLSGVRIAFLGSAGLLAVGLGISPALADGFCPGGGNPLANGGCGVTGGGAFSSAALGSQSLSEVSASLTRQSTDLAVSAVRRRREQETQPTPARRAQRQARREQREAPPAREKRRVVRHEPRTDAKSPDMLVYKAPPPPLYVGPTYALWTNGFGDWERRKVDSTGDTPLGEPQSVHLTRKATTWGFLSGADITLGGGYGNGVFIVGALSGYMSTNVKLSGSSTPLTNSGTNIASTSTVNATISGPSIGAYATFANGPLSSDLTVKADFLTIDQSSFEAFANAAAQTVSFGASVDVTNVSVAGNVNYRFVSSPYWWWEPTTGFRYTRSNFGSNAAVLGLTDGSVFRVQGGVRVGHDYMWNAVHVVGTVTGLIYSDVSVDGLVLNTGGFAGNTVLPSDEGKIRGQGIATLNFDYGNGFTSFVQADVRGGKDLFGVGGRVGLRINLN
jgi:hypothetical protein